MWTRRKNLRSERLFNFPFLLLCSKQNRTFCQNICRPPPHQVKLNSSYKFIYFSQQNQCCAFHLFVHNKSLLRSGPFLYLEFRSTFHSDLNAEIWLAARITLRITTKHIDKVRWDKIIIHIELINTDNSPSLKYYITIWGQLCPDLF